ncbi:DUF4292 domain-containing protein [Flavobacterium litorale]|uniref:DUF4292 domain-containing protein n=1 Tax=Flavobacterium litorale TaxID=2856519 RepID=A0ABX8V8D5_9FLAO|nr:DUF4292 domain-containing protein [Flavobacterium litorale]QYJ69097.1 DUF4292 domain-containing protein [Flavobacterium litorale]
MRKITAFLLTVTVLLLASCKSKQQAILAEKRATKPKTTAQIIQGHYTNKKDFKTLYIRAGVRYSDKNTSQKLSADIRIKKDEKILVSLKFLGITMAKGLITPEGVSYYEKLNNTYFQGNYAMLSRWLGADLDYNKVQNLILGKALYNLNEGNYKSGIKDDLYVLGDTTGGITKLFMFEGGNFLLKKEVIAQGGMDARSLDIQYPSHSQYPNAVLPAAIKVMAEQNDKVTIDIEYNTVTFDEDFSFPYSVPVGFEQIFLD